MKKRWDLLIWVGLALILVIYLIVRSDNRISYDLPVWEEIALDNIRSLELAGPDGSFSLNKNGEEWYLEPGSDKANNYSASALAGQMTSLKFIDMVSEKGSLGRFGLEDGETVLLNTVLIEGDSTPSIYIGNTSSSNRYTYVRFAGEEVVYTVRGDLKKNAFQSAVDFRDKTVFSLDSSLVTEVEIKTPEAEYKISKEGDSWSVAEEEEIDAESLIGRFSRVEASEWNDNRQDGERWDFSFVFRSSGGEQTLSFNKAEEGDATIKAVSSTAKHPFSLSSSFVDEVILLIPGNAEE